MLSRLGEIRDFRRRYYNSPSVAYYASEIAAHPAIPVAIDAGADLMKQLEELVEWPPDEQVMALARVIELLANDRDTGPLFRTQLVREKVDMVRELGQFIKALESCIS